MTAPMPYTREELQEFAYDTSGAYMTEDVPKSGRSVWSCESWAR